LIQNHQTGLDPRREIEQLFVDAPPVGPVRVEEYHRDPNSAMRATVREETDEQFEPVDVTRKLCIRGDVLKVIDAQQIRRGMRPVLPGRLIHDAVLDS
jgi:hypothetical protein